jgi:hypothetical protein
MSTRGRAVLGARRGARAGGRIGSAGMALGLGALLGGIGLIAAGARRRQDEPEHSSDNVDLDRELDALGLRRQSGEGSAPRLEQGSDGILRQVVDTTAAEVEARR